MAMTPSRKPRPLQPGIETDLAANPAARAWLHAALSKNLTYREIARHLQTEFGIERSLGRLSAYFHRHTAEINAASVPGNIAGATAYSPGFEVTVTAPGAEYVTVQICPLPGGTVGGTP